MSEKQPKYLLIKHSKGWDVDRVGEWMKAEGKCFDRCYPADGDEFPAVEDYAGIVIFGGASSVNDGATTKWVRDELVFVEQILKQDIPLFGICLGAQMLAQVLGSAIKTHPTEQKEVGFHPIYPTEDSGDFLREPLTVMQWHSEGFDTPEGCTRIAEGEIFQNQAFRYGEKHFAVQFHPEINPAALAIWHERNKRRETGQLDDQARELQRNDAIRYDPSISRWLDDFMQRWTS